MFAYNVERPDHFANLRKEAAEQYRGLTAIVSGKPYLVVDREAVEFVLEGQDGEKLWMEGGFETFARNEHNALIAASRVNRPFVPGSKLGDWTIGKLAFVDGKWYVRQAGTDQVVPIEELVQMMEDNDWYETPFLSNFEIHGAADEALEAYMPEVESNVGWTREELPNTPVEYNLDSMTVFADRRDYDHWNEDADRMWWEEEGKHVQEEPYDDEPYGAADSHSEALGEAGDEGYDAAGEDINLAELVPPYKDFEMMQAFVDGFVQGRKDNGGLMPTQDEIDSILGVNAYQDSRDSRPWGDAYSSTKEAQGMEQMGLVIDAAGKVIGQFLKNLPNGRWLILNAQGSQEVDPAQQQLHIEKGASRRTAELVQDIPYNADGLAEVVHGYEDGDVVLADGTTSFDPERAYGWLLGQKDFDGAAKVKQFIDRSPPKDLPESVIPPDQAMSPQTELPGQDPAEAPLDPTGGEGAPAPGAPAPGAPAPNAGGGVVQPPTTVPPMPGRPAASVKEGYGIPPEDMIDRTPPNHRCLDCGGEMVEGPVQGAWFCSNCGVGDDMTGRAPYQDIRPDFAKRPRASVEEVEFFASKEARKNFSLSEQKELVNENLEGTARNFDKLNLDGTHYELENESSLDDFLWQ